MSFQTPLTVNEVITDIHAKKYLLPSIQREFEWSQDQIKTLFDSLIRDYTINAFRFWRAPNNKAADFKFFEFLRDYHKKDNHHKSKESV